MSANNETIYIKADMCTVVTDRNVVLNDVIKMECSNTAMLRQVKQMKLFTFPDMSSESPMKNRSEAFSILKVIERIHEDYPQAEVVSIGEQDFIVEYAPVPEKPKWLEVTKLVVLCIVIFFGAAFTIMAFNNDISVTEVFDKFYQQIMGVEKPQITELEVFYCIGLATGIMVFFNHIGRKKITSDPTPVQVEMRKYEKDMDTAFIENASRKGHNQDVG